MADDDRFYVKSLTLENFRCFERLELTDLHPHFNLIIGENGTGKSSVLVALASLFWQLAAPDNVGSAPPLVDVRDARIPAAAPGVLPEFLSWTMLAEFDWRGEARQLRREVQPGLIPSSPSLQRGPGIAGATSDSIGLFAPDFRNRQEILALYTVRRGFTDRPTGSPAQPYLHNLALAYENWHDAGLSGASLREWLKNQTFIALQREERLREYDVSALPSSALPQLSLVNEAVRLAVSGAKKVEFDAALDDIALQINGGGLVSFRSLSDGQRALLGLIADLARRVCLLNYERFGNETLSKSTGLVLIDEIDLHLHPKWQREIVGALKGIFPKIQFFATTHSPQVIGEARPEEIVLLTKDGKQERPSRSLGMDSNWVLECIMRAQGRDPETGAKINAMLRALDEGQYELARSLMEELRDQIGEDPSVAATDAYLWNLGLDRDEAAE